MSSSSSNRMVMMRMIPLRFVVLLSRSMQILISDGIKRSDSMVVILTLTFLLLGIRRLLMLAVISQRYSSVAALGLRFQTPILGQNTTIIELQYPFKLLFRSLPGIFPL
jgi:hypothetical protein